MPFDLKYRSDGDAASAANINEAFQDFQAFINDLPVAAIHNGCFNHDHGVTVFPAEDPPVFANESGLHSYSFGVFGSQIVWTSYGANGTTERVPVGAAGASGTYSGGPVAKTFASPIYVDHNNSSNVHGILCLANLEVENMTRGQEAGPIFLIVALQASINGTWYGIKESEMAWSLDDRRIESGDRLAFDAPVVCYIDDQTLIGLGVSPSADPIAGIRLVFALSAATTGTAIVFSRVNMSLLPMYADGL